MSGRGGPGFLFQSICLCDKLRLLSLRGCCFPLCPYALKYQDLCGLERLVKEFEAFQCFTEGVGE